ncbi:MAG TPA: nuclear transport factor 2 family protein [Bacteroidota bacterium]|nr:nuclear transport factor 2 family protein [Bacteroidota bacterium]
MLVDDKIQSRKASAVDFLQLIVSGEVDEAYKKYADMKGKHHNPYVPAGLPSLQKAMADDNVRSPGKKLTVKNVLADGNLVAVHSHLVMRQGETGMIVVHLFRFDGDRIMEFWDCGQQIPPDSPNKDGAF